MSETQRKLAEGWQYINLLGRQAVQVGMGPQTSLRAIGAVLDWTVWFPAHAAPPECFADPAPAPDDVLKPGERVYVDCPERLGFARATGWADITSLPSLNPIKANVRFDNSGFAHAVPRAACHREGPSGPPPAGEPTFLGRVDIPGRREDAWWLPEARAVRIWGDAWSVDTIMRPVGAESIWRPIYRAALAVARALGLVEAEAEPASTDQILQRMGDRVIDAIGAAHKPEPEPERPEPKFVAGQVVEFGAAHNLHVRRIVGEAEWGQQGGIEQWLYPTETLDGQSGRCGETYQQHPDYDLRPHTMSIADVPNEVKLAIIDGKPVRVVDVPVTEKGTPYSDKLGSAEPDWLQRGKAVTVTGVGDIDEPGAVIEQKDGGCFWPWNVTLAKPGE